MEKHGLRVLENMALRKTLGPERDEVTRECRRLYSSPRILPSKGFARTVALVRVLIACHVFSAAGTPVNSHPVVNVKGARERRATGNRESFLLLERFPFAAQGP